jgi:hypothetical protein
VVFQVGGGGWEFGEGDFLVGAYRAFYVGTGGFWGAEHAAGFGADVQAFEHILL